MGAPTEGKDYCNGEHRFHVATDGVVESEGKVFVIALCLHCGVGVKHEHVVAKPTSNIVLTQKEKP